MSTSNDSLGARPRLARRRCTKPNYHQDRATDRPKNPKTQNPKNEPDEPATQVYQTVIKGTTVSMLFIRHSPSLLSWLQGITTLFIAFMAFMVNKTVELWGYKRQAEHTLHVIHGFHGTITHFIIFIGFHVLLNLAAIAAILKSAAVTACSKVGMGLGRIAASCSAAFLAFLCLQFPPVLLSSSSSS